MDCLLLRKPHEKQKFPVFQVDHLADEFQVRQLIATSCSSERPLNNGLQSNPLF